MANLLSAAKFIHLVISSPWSVKHTNKPSPFPHLEPPSKQNRFSITPYFLLATNTHAPDVLCINNQKLFKNGILNKDQIPQVSEFPNTGQSWRDSGGHREPQVLYVKPGGSCRYLRFGRTRGYLDQELLVCNIRYFSIIHSKYETSFSGLNKPSIANVCKYRLLLC